MLASPCLTEEGVEGVVSSPNSLVTWHLAIRLNAVFQTVELPAGIADLDTSLANVDGDALTLWWGERERERKKNNSLTHTHKTHKTFNKNYKCLWKPNLKISF